MPNAETLTAHMQSAPFPNGKEGDGVDVPEWIHLVPVGADGVISTHDERGPYVATDLHAVIEASMAANDRLPIDENHVTDHGAGTGMAAPARGWITEMEARADGIWARVEWTKAGRELVSDRAYRGISPVIVSTVDEPHELVGVLRASLTNTPNMRGMVTLHEKETQAMDWKKMLMAELGLAEGASDDDIKAALKKAMAGGKSDPEMQSTIEAVGKVVGFDADAEGADLVKAVQSAIAKKPEGDQSEVIVALQEEVKDLAGKLKTTTETHARQKAEEFVDGAIKLGRPGVKPMRDTYITEHMRDASGTEARINAIPPLAQSHTTTLPPSTAGGTEVSLNEAEMSVAKAMGKTPEQFAADRDAAGKKES
ncbi:MAG: phage protease [Pseudomonadota bacterium]